MAKPREKGATPGVIERHARRCRSREGASCDCKPFYEAWAWSSVDGKRVSKSFPTRSAAKGWRTDAMAAIRRHELRAPTSETLREACERWLKGCERGEILSRNRQPYKPSTLRGYRRDLETHVLPTLGTRRLGAVDHADLQAIVDRLVGSGLSGSKVRNIVVPLQAIFRRRRRELAGQSDHRPGAPAPGRQA